MPSWAGYFVILDEAGNGIPIGSLSSEELTRVKVGQSGCYIYPLYVSLVLHLYRDCGLLVGSWRVRYYGVFVILVDLPGFVVSVVQSQYRLRSYYNTEPSFFFGRSYRL